MVEHDCEECGVRQRVDSLIRMEDRVQAINTVFEKCTNCTRHPSVDLIGVFCQVTSTDMTDNWVPRVQQSG